jgi:hypothetical protein
MAETTQQPEIPPHDPDIKYMSDDINTPVLVIAVFVTAVIVLISIFGVQAFYYYMDGRNQATKVINDDDQNRSVEADHLQFQQLQKLSGKSAWVDLDKDRVKIPIEDAMRLVVEELGEQQADGSGQPPKESEDIVESEETGEETDSEENTDSGDESEESQLSHGS